MAKFQLILQGLQAVLASWGGFGLFALGFLDATFLPFPSVNDILLINLCIRFPDRLLYYSLMSTAGSVLGCLLLYYLGRMGEEAAFHKKAGAEAPRVHRWVERNGFITMFIVAILPPPLPLKVFVLAAGALDMPARAFLLATLLARGLRFYGEGYLAIHYGSQATRFLGSHKASFGVGSVVVLVGSYVVYRMVMGRKQRQES